MSIPEYLSYSTVTSSSNSKYTIINTKNCRNKHFNNYFQSDSNFYTENSKLNNIKRIKILQKHTILHYTINDTTDSDSITSISENSNNYKNSDMAYISSINDDSISKPLNKLNNNRRNKKKSNKCIQPKNINITGTTKTTKVKNQKLRQKRIIILTRSNLHKNKNKSKTIKHTNSKNLVNTNRNITNKPKSNNSDKTNVQDNNNTGTSTHKRNYRHQQNNKTNDLKREKQFTEEEPYKSKSFRHLRSIESRIKRFKSKKEDYAQAEEDPSSTN